MIKRLVVGFAFLLTTLTYLFTNRLFVLEEAIAVYNGKSSGQLVSERVMPFNDYDGVFKVLSAGNDYKNIIKNLNAKLVYIEVNGDIVSEYYYSNSIPKKEIIKGKKVNLHVAKSNNQVVVGTPIIYGSY